MTINHWRGVFNKLDHWVRKQNGDIAVLGIGETFDLIFVYSSIDWNKITLGLDINTGRAEARALPFPLRNKKNCTRCELLA